MENINAVQFEILSPAFVFICILMVLGIPGNIVSILVYGLQLRSTTGRYAIITLAVCDVINCVMSIPVEMYIMTRYWSFDNAALCKMSRFVTYAMNNAAGLILVAIAFERYRTICTPHKPKIPKHYIKGICVAIVLCGIVLALPALWIYGIQTVVLSLQNGHLVKVQEVTFGENRTNGTEDAIYNLSKHMDNKDTNLSANVIITKICLIDDQIRNPFWAYSMIGFVTLAGIGVLVILVLVYGQIAWKIRKLRALINTPSKIERAVRSAKKKQVTFMLFLITLVFEFNYIPFIIITNMRFFNPEWYNDQPKVGKMIYHFFLRFYLVNCSINPFIYCISSPQFRSALCTLHTRIVNTTSYVTTERQSNRITSGLGFEESRRLSGFVGGESRRLSGVVGAETRRLSGIVDGESRRLSGFVGGESRRLSGFVDGESRRLSGFVGGKSRRLSGVVGAESTRSSGVVGAESIRPSSVIGAESRKSSGVVGSESKKLSGDVVEGSRRLNTVIDGDSRKLNCAVEMAESRC